MCESLRLIPTTGKLFMTRFFFFVLNNEMFSALCFGALVIKRVIKILRYK